ncbi:MAG: gamma-glutamyltransferase [Candidatus Hydrogenedentes bacterium]|nr:gamma-glutamyltransferase [Candidatus Hydrogenedentota bacterium]
MKTNFAITLLALCCVIVHPVTTLAEASESHSLRAEHAMVVSASRLASEAGVEMMREGGNAFDAAAATGFVLAVTYPQAGNLGGGGFLVARTAAGESFTLDFRETAPAAAHRDMYLDEDGNVIAGSSLYTPLASGVPGSVDGLLRMWRDHGSGNISRKVLLAPAIRFAEEGFILSSSMAATLNKYRDRLSADSAATRIFNPKDGSEWKEGDRLVQRDLAGTLRRIAAHGRKGFYKGPVARAFAKQMDATGGLITKKDLARYRSVYRDPVVGTFHGYEIISMGPPSSGGIFLIQMLNMLEGFDLNALGQGSSRYVHLLTEVQRRAYADRAEFLGDPDFFDVPAAGLMDKRYAVERMADFSFDHATPSSEIAHGAPAPYESPETTHYSVVDPAGNAVAITITLNTLFGSGIVVRGAGFLLNNEMDDFSAKPGVPNVYGLIGNEANAIQPRKRMLSSMTPTIVTENGQTRYVLGTPGGSTIITTILQIFLNAAVHGMDIRQAVAAPRHHSQWLPDVIYTESKVFSDETRSALESLGHTIKPYPNAPYIGVANCIEIAPDGLHGAPDPRLDNAAVGY